MKKNIELENANLQRLQMLIELGQQLAAEREPVRLLQSFATLPATSSARNVRLSACSAQTAIRFSIFSAAVR
jgi:hypothetical protein